MEQILEFIFTGCDYGELTPASLFCLFVFLAVLECISAIVREAVKGLVCNVYVYYRYCGVSVLLLHVHTVQACFEKPVCHGILCGKRFI